MERIYRPEPGGVPRDVPALHRAAGGVLAGAVADTVSPVGLSAEAANVVGGAGELSLGNAGHVVNAEVLSEG